jgi:hypothetical protein
MFQVTLLGEPRRQNRDGCRARPGDICRLAEQCPREKSAEKEGLIRRIEHLQTEPINDCSDVPAFCGIYGGKGVVFPAHPLKW